MLIFAVDDDRACLDEARRAIAQAVPEAAIMTFGGASEALSAVVRDRLYPDVVFSDIVMPDMTGIELAARLRTLRPDARTVFVTAFPEYALEAFGVHAQGYILKPLTPDAVRGELDAARITYEKLRVRCFGHFEVFMRGEHVFFRRKKAKELFAYLIDREGALCTTEQAAALLWEDESDTETAKHRFRTVLSDLRATLRAVGCEDVLVRRSRQIGVRRDALDCDYYRMLDGDADAAASFRGEYMLDYSWAEPTTGRLIFGKNL